MRYRIYYGDGSTYSGDPFKAPRTDVQVIAQDANNEKGFVLLHGNTERGYFFWADDIGWLCGDTGGFWDYLLQLGPRVVLLGRNIRDEKFWEIIHRAGMEGLG